MLAAGGELEMGACAGQRQEHAVVAGVVLESSEFGQREPVAVEAHDLGQAFGVASEANLHQDMIAGCKGRDRRFESGDTAWRP